MADIGRPLLAAIESLLATKMASGESLEGIKSRYVKYTESDLPQEFGSVPPVLMVDMLPMSAQNVSIPACMTRKVYPVRFQIFTENAGDTTNSQAAMLIDAIEDVFYQQRFSLASIVNLISKDYTIPATAPFQAPYSGGASLVFAYEYTDTRAIPTQL